MQQDDVEAPSNREEVHRMDDWGLEEEVMFGDLLDGDGEDEEVDEFGDHDVQGLDDLSDLDELDEVSLHDLGGGIAAGVGCGDADAGGAAGVGVAAATADPVGSVLAHPAGPMMWVVAEQHPDGFNASRLVPVFQADGSGTMAVFATDYASQATDAVRFACDREGVSTNALTVTRRQT